jgi:predicted nucleotidyltransferase
MKDIRAIAERIAEKFDVEKIILFGSYSHGAPNKHSDIDLLVILNRSRRNWKINGEMYKAISPLPCSVDLVVRTGKEIKERIPQGDWFLKDIVEDGLILYESRRN